MDFIKYPLFLERADGYQVFRQSGLEYSRQATKDLKLTVGLLTARRERQRLARDIATTATWTAPRTRSCAWTWRPRESPSAAQVYH